MTKAFERFLRSFSDEELAAFARDRAAARPPYWKLMRLALRIESSRRGLRLEEDLVAHLESEAPAEEARSGTA